MKTDYLLIWWQLKTIILVSSIAVVASGFLGLIMLNRFQILGEKYGKSSLIYGQLQSNTDFIQNN